MATKRKDLSTSIVFEGESATTFAKSLKRPLSVTQKKTIDKSVGVYDYYQAKWTKQTQQ